MLVDKPVPVCVLTEQLDSGFLSIIASTLDITQLTPTLNKDFIFLFLTWSWIGLSGKSFRTFIHFLWFLRLFISHAQFQRPAMQSHCWRDAVQFQRARNKGGAMLTVSRQFILFHNFLKAVKLADMIQQDKQSFRQRCLKAPVYWWACSSQQTCDPWQSWHNKTHS